ncbi:TMEM14A [Cervus elaphus hippelaphus]|uniref:TMEM14A n=1 Tax=Cervus elaphus hippelaphus TaxID=46360 RepID=A0A212D504_CEREH|nr:TMEM14A [Cervus elaphus hippelaphus]
MQRMRMRGRGRCFLEPAAPPSAGRAQEDLSVCPSARGNAGQVLGAEGDGLATGISDRIFPVTRRRGVLSLIAGLFIGFLAGYGAYRVSNDKRDVKLSLSFFLATIMGVRFKRSKKIMPAGLVAGLRIYLSETV